MKLIYNKEDRNTNLLTVGRSYEIIASSTFTQGGLSYYTVINDLGVHSNVLSYCFATIAWVRKQKIKQIEDRG